MKKQIFNLLSIIWILSVGIAFTTSCTEKNHKKEIYGTASPNKNKKLKEKDKASEKHSAEYLKHRVENIYKEVCGLYRNSEDYDDSHVIVEQISEAQLEEKYCSNDWNTKMEEVFVINATIHKDDYPYPDGDYWIMGQDFSDISVSDIKVEEMDGDNAVVSFKLHNYGSIIPVRLDMVFERDDWFIDNFHNFVDHSYEESVHKGTFSDWKKDMVEYINESMNLINEKKDDYGNQNSSSSIDYPANYKDQSYTTPPANMYQEDNTPRQPIRNRCVACQRNPGICGGCDGTGRIKMHYHSTTGEWMTRECNDCGGTGQCHACKGDGWLDEGFDF